MTSPDLKPTEVHYPSSDGEPMAESDRNRNVMIDLLTAGAYHFRDRDDVYVSGDLFVYFEEGNPAAVVAPDFFVVRGVPGGERRTYKLWEEGKAPELAIEVTSPKSHITDLGNKRAIYERLGVLEYYVFDPEGVDFIPPLRGFRLRDGNLVPVDPIEKPDGTLVYSSEVLDLELHANGKFLRLVNPRTGEQLPIPEDLVEKVRAESERAEAERERAEAERERAEAERERAEAERERAEAEKKRAEAAEAELARLRQELGQDEE
jgi:Uma2 family endonuclease